MVYYTEKEKEFVNEMPVELRRILYSLSNDLSIAVFLVLFKHGKQSQEQIINVLDVPSCFLGAVELNIKYLQKSSLISSTRENGILYYEITELGERVLNNLMKMISQEG